MQFLTGPTIQKAVHALFSKKTRGKERKIFVAYVGRGGAALLPDVHGAEIYCSPSPLGTSALGIESLLQAGAKVFFIDDLHMKVFWAEGEGAVVGSANLSWRGFHENHEAAIRVASDQVDVEALLRSLNPRPVTSEELTKLGRANDIYRGRNPKIPPDGPAPEPDFKEWFRHTGRREWKLGWYSEEKEPTLSVVKKAETLDPDAEITDTMSAKDYSTYEEGDWILNIGVSDRSKLPLTHSPIAWMYTRGVARVTPQEAKEHDDDERYLRVAFQLGEPNIPPPFRLDESVQNAIRKAYREHALGWMDKDEIPLEKHLAHPPAEFLDTILSYCREDLDS